MKSEIQTLLDKLALELGVCLNPDAVNEFVEMIREELVRAKEQHKPKNDFDTASLAEHFLAVIQGSILVMKATQDRSIMQRSLEHFKNYIKTLFSS